MTRTAGMLNKLALPEMKSVLLPTSGSEKELHPLQWGLGLA